MNRIADRRQRIAQLMREDGEEFVFSTILLLDLLEEARIVERDRGARCQLGRHRERVGIQFASRCAQSQ